MTNESALLGLLADLYRDRAALESRVAVLEAEVATLRRALEVPDPAQPAA